MVWTDCPPAGGVQLYRSLPGMTSRRTCPRRSVCRQNMLAGVLKYPRFSAKSEPFQGMRRKCALSLLPRGWRVSLTEHKCKNLFCTEHI